MAEIEAQAACIRDALAAIPALRAESEEPNEVNPTQGKGVAFPLLREVGYDEAFRGETTVYTWDVVVLAAPEALDRPRGQRAVDPYIAPDGPSSIPAALYADPTLGGTVDDLKVNRAYDRGLIQVGDKSFWGAKIEVQTWS